jgi:hypothetical protein
MWQDELERLQHAVNVASRAEIKAAESIRQLIDVSETEATTGRFAYPGSFWAIWEWADISLDEFLGSPDDDPAVVSDQVERNVGAALAVLHRAGIVHMDVAPNNILRVGQTWKLADLDSCVPLGAPAVRRPLNERYVHPDLDGARPPARGEFDLYGLSQVVARLR